MRLFVSFSLILAGTISLVHAQLLPDGQAAVPYARFDSSSSIPLVRTPQPLKTPEIALRTFHELSLRQDHRLAAFTARSLIQTSLPSTSQHAELEVLMRYVAPRTLQFTQVRFEGDPFIKRNVIARMLQAEVDRVVKQEGRKLAITSNNYNIHYKGQDLLDGRQVHVYGVKPRYKVPGLFRGEICLDPLTGNLLRARGTIVKSPSFFVRRIEFVQDYAEFDGFTLPVSLHSIIKARVLGKVVVDVSTQNYSVSARRDIIQAAVTGN
jgi:hypothetical protein